MYKGIEVHADDAMCRPRSIISLSFKQARRSLVGSAESIEMAVCDRSSYRRSLFSTIREGRAVPHFLTG